MESTTYTVMELASVLKISRTKAYELVHRKGFPSFYVDGSLRIDTAGLTDWMNQQKNIKESQLWKN